MSIKSAVCKDSTISGDVKLGNGNVFHQRCNIVAEKGPILIGDDNLIEENVIILNENPEPLVIGSNNHFLVGAIIKGSVGDNCVVEERGSVASKSFLGNNSTIGVSCCTRANEKIEENSIIFGKQNGRMQNNEPVQNRIAQHKAQLQYFREVLNVFHDLRTDL